MLRNHGVHPYHASEPGPAGSEYYSQLRQAVKGALAEPAPLIKAFGELGLDYDRLVHADKETQIATFKAQFHAAWNEFDSRLAIVTNIATTAIGQSVLY